MIRSMTAFARVSRALKNRFFSVEIRSLNHRYFDYSSKLPTDFLDYENAIRDLVRSSLTRGKINVSISVSSEGESETLSLNEEVLNNYLSAARKLKKQYKIPGDISLNDVLVLPRLFTSQKEKGDISKDWTFLSLLLKEAIKKTIQAKKVEGLKISRDMKDRLKNIMKSVKRIERHAAGRSEYFFQKTKTRLKALLAEANVEEERIWREAVFLADRSDVTEEIVRLKGHLQLFEERLLEDKEIGRELDFLCQELHREINTLGSKAQFFEISKDVIYIKGEIEKIREQVQNVE